MTADTCWRPETGSEETGDSLYARLRALERRDAPEEDYRVMIEDFYAREPAVRAAMPQFSAFGLLEAIRKSRHPEQPITLGRFGATTKAAIELLRQLSCEDVSLSHPWHSPNHPHFSSLAGICGGLFFWVATSAAGTGAALLVGFVGAICCYLIAAFIRFQMRNSTRRTERPQWICALHVDRYLQAHHRGEPLAGLRVEQLPNPGFRRKPPFYDLHNQIMAGARWVYRPHLRETPPLVFAARTDED